MAISTGLIIVVALIHTWFMVLESFLWTRDSTRKKFRMSREQAAFTAPLAANQGLYNFFLAAGLVFALFHQQSDLYRAVCVFFLSCVVTAGFIGAMTVNKRIFFVQGVPALLALLALWLENRP